MVANSLLENDNNRPWSKHSKKPPKQTGPSDKVADDNASKSVSKVCKYLWLRAFRYRMSCELDMDIV